MAQGTPEKIKTRSETGKVKETTPVSSMVETLASFVNMIQKINDLADARKALGEAGDLFAQGKTDEAKDLAFSIFERLKQVGKMPEKLDIATIQKRTRLGQYGDLAKDINEVREGEATKNEAHPRELVEKIQKIRKSTQITDPKNPEYITLQHEIESEVGDRQTAINTEEKQVQTELIDLLGKIEAKSGQADIKEQVHNVAAVIDAGFVGHVDVERQVEQLKDRIKENIQQFEKKGNKASAGDWAGVIGKVATGRTPEALDQVAGIVQKSAKGEQIFVHRLEKLLTGMEKVKEEVGKGLGIQEAVRTLDEAEIREVRAMLSSVSKIDDVDARSPYYDEKYVDFMGDLKMGKDEIIGFQKVLDAVDVSYRRGQLERGVGNSGTLPERQSKRNKNDFADAEFVVDEAGNPVLATGGMESSGFMTAEDGEALFRTGRENYNEVYEELPNGSFRERDYEEQLGRAMKRSRDMKLQRNEQRESFLNINMQELFEHMKAYDQENGTNLYGMIDEDFYREHQVAKLTDEVMHSKEAKEEFENWWYQEVSFNQRGLAYEGLFERRNQSPRMQRLNSLMEIIGVSTAKKGLANWMSMSYGTIDQQNNSYVNAEFMGKLATFWTNQGVDFRLEDMLKQYREEMCLVENGERGRSVGTISVFDAVTFLQKDITNPELRTKLKIPEWWKGKFGTMVYKYSETGIRDDTRRVIWDHFLEKELGVDLSTISVTDQQTLSNKYQLMFDLAFQYSVVHKQLHQMVGNASFVKGEIELPGAAAEMHLKLDPLAYSKLFAPRFQFLNVQFKEAWALFDPGVRDYITMAPQDYASHFTEKSVGKDGLFRRVTDNGSPTIGRTFLGFGENSATPEQLEAEAELCRIFSGKYDKHDKLLEEGALWQWGVKPGTGKNHEMDIYLELGVYGDQKSSFRRSAGEVSKILSEKVPSRATLEMINWDKYFDIAKNPRIKERINAATTPEAKWKIFAETFGEHSFNHATPSAKRSGDHPVKYGVEKFNKYVEAFMGWANDPFNQEKFDALLDVPTEVNAAIVAGRAEKNLKFLIQMSERMGRRELGGGKMKRFERDPHKNTIKVDTSHGLNSENSNEWPGIKTEDITNSNWYWDSIQNASIPESLGIGVPADKQIMLDLIKAQRAKGRLPDHLYREFFTEIVNSVLYEHQLGPIVNAYRWITLEAPLERIAPLFGITGHELHRILEENTEKSAEKFWHYLNGGGH